MLLFSTAEGQNNNLCSFLNKNIYSVVHLNTEIIIPNHATKLVVGPSFVVRTAAVFRGMDSIRCLRLFSQRFGP